MVFTVLRCDKGNNFKLRLTFKMPAKTNSFAERFQLILIWRQLIMILRLYMKCSTSASDHDPKSRFASLAKLAIKINVEPNVTHHLTIWKFLQTVQELLLIFRRHHSIHLERAQHKIVITEIIIIKCYKM